MKAIPDQVPGVTPADSYQCLVFEVGQTLNERNVDGQPVSEANNERHYHSFFDPMRISSHLFHQSFLGLKGTEYQQS